MHTASRPPFERFSVAFITVVGLLSLALALHIDAVDMQRDARSTASHARP